MYLISSADTSIDNKIIYMMLIVEALDRCTICPWQSLIRAQMRHTELAPNEPALT